MIWKKIKNSVLRFLKDMQYRIGAGTLRFKAWISDRFDDFRAILGFRDY
ncbi:MAG: hypothetical protein ACOCG6_06885 [Candidatus Cloacimonadaceae bacterium]